MRKLFAILMIAIHLFNLAGYNLVFGYYALRSDKTVVRRLDNNQYNDSELVEIKVKLNLPYMTVLGNYERFDGEFTLNGEYYKYVKRKISHDTLYMLCLQDYHKGQIYKEKNEFASKVNEQSPGNTGKNENTSTVKKVTFTGEYCCQMKQADLSVFRTDTRESIPVLSPDPLDTYITSIGQPPEIGTSFYC